jgi:hypothetical protein
MKDIPQSVSQSTRKRNPNLYGGQSMKGTPERLDAAAKPGNRLIEGYPAAPATPKHDAVSERKVHDQIANWLRLNQTWFHHSRMDRKTTSECGTPDFIFAWRGQPVAVEVKVAGNTLSEDQVRVKNEMALSLWNHRVVSSLPEMIEYLTNL